MTCSICSAPAELSSRGAEMPYCAKHEGTHWREWQWCDHSGCLMRAVADTRFETFAYCFVHGGADYVPCTKERGPATCTHCAAESAKEVAP